MTLSDLEKLHADILLRDICNKVTDVEDAMVDAYELARALGVDIGNVHKDIVKNLTIFCESFDTLYMKIAKVL